MDTTIPDDISIIEILGSLDLSLFSHKTENALSINDPSAVEHSSSNGTLTVKSKPNSGTAMSKVRVSISKIETVIINGSNLVSLMNLNSEGLKVSVQGSNKITSSNSIVTKLTITVNGNNQIQFNDLSTKISKVTGSGVNNLELNVKQDLFVKLDGPNTLKLIGNPSIDNNSSELLSIL